MNLGPHNIDLSIPRGVTRTRSRHHHFDMVAKLKRAVSAARDEAAKRTVNAARASGRHKSGAA